MNDSYLNVKLWEMQMEQLELGEEGGLKIINSSLPKLQNIRIKGKYFM